MCNVLNRSTVELENGVRSGCLRLCLGAVDKEVSVVVKGPSKWELFMNLSRRSNSMELDTHTVVWHCSWGTLNTSHRELRAGQSNNTTKSNWWSNEFIGVTYRSRSEGLITGAGMTQRQCPHQKPTQAWVMAHKNWRLGAHCETCMQLRSNSLVQAAWLLWGSSHILITLGEGSLCF